MNDTDSPQRPRERGGIKCQYANMRMQLFGGAYTAYIPTGGAHPTPVPLFWVDVQVHA